MDARSTADQFVEIERDAAEPTPSAAAGRMTEPERRPRAWPRSTCPTSGCPTRRPSSRRRIYAAGLERLRERMDARGYDRLVVYADREHSANLAWLTGFDPRFEEAVVDRRPDRRPGDPRRQRVLGARPGPRRCRCAATSSRTSACRASRATARQPLADVLGGEGIARGSRVGVAGWKTYASPPTHRGPRLPRRRAPRARRPDRPRRERRRPASSTRPTGCGSSTRSSSSPYLEWAACQTSDGVPPPRGPGLPARA